MHNRGMIGYFILLILVAGLLAVFFGYDYYTERYFLTFYDGPMVRHLEIPSFASRISPANHEYYGVCTFSVALLPEQAEMVLSGSCVKRGFLFKNREKGFEIEVTPTYKVQGKYIDQYLTLVWDPVLDEKTRKKAEKVPAPAKPASATFLIEKPAKSMY